MFYSISLYLILSRRSFRSFNFVFSLFFDSEGWRGRTSCEFIFSRVLSLGLVSLETGDIFVSKRGEKGGGNKRRSVLEGRMFAPLRFYFRLFESLCSILHPLIIIIIIIHGGAADTTFSLYFFLSPRTRRSHAELERRFDTWNKIRASSVSCHEPRLRRARST